MKEPVEDGYDRDGGGEDRVPLPVALVIGDDYAFGGSVALVADFAQAGGFAAFRNLEADLVEHEQRAL